MKAVIMAGGKGTRLAPLTNEVPKPLVKIIDKPIMEHILELLKKYGITDIAVTIGYKGECIVDYFKDGTDFGVNLKYYRENEPLGTAGSVKRTLNFMDDDFLVISGDAYTDLDLASLIEFHFEKKGKLTIVATEFKNPVGLGVIELGKSNKVTKFLEKPVGIKEGIVNCGIYVINKSAFEDTPDGFYDFGKQLLPKLIGDIYAYVTEDYWSDIGTLPSYYYTNYLIAQKMPSATLYNRS